MRRFGRALLYGGLAAIVGTIVYFLILWGTGYEVGLIAIAVGWMVGKAVFAGSGGRGGMKYQLLAAGLTYLSICSSYVPMVYQGLTEQVEESADESGAVVTLEADPSGAAGEGGPPPTAQELANAQPAPENIEDVEMGVVYTVETDSETEMSVVGLLVVGVVVFALALAAPFLAGLENLIGIFIIGIGLWEAWKANAIPVAVVEGPFSVGAEGEGRSDRSEADD